VILAANVRRIRRELLSSAEVAAPELDGVVAHLAAIERGAGALSLWPVEDFAIARHPNLAVWGAWSAVRRSNGGVEAARVGWVRAPVNGTRARLSPPYHLFGERIPVTGEDEPPWLQGIAGDDARELIESDERLIRVVAGPGAGKTTCLKRRTRRLRESKGVPSEKIFVGTFTRAIASDLRNELGEEIAVSTLHSLAYRLLRANPGACQGMKLRFLLVYEEAVMLFDIAHLVPGVANHNARRDELRRLQSHRSQRQEYEDAVFAGAVRGWLQRHGGILVGEVVYLATTGLESEDIPRGEFDHVVVDEYQDLTAAEQELVELVWSGQGSLVVMGDNNQSIYGFRFNHPDGINEFLGRWEGEGAIDLSCPDNRRCGEAILQIANLMMAESGGGEAMVPASGRAGAVDLVHWPNITAEIAGIAEYIRRHHEDSFLVLVPRRFIGYRLKDAVGDDARTAFHEEILRHPVAAEAFACASALADTADGVAVRAWLALHSSNAQPGPDRNASAYRTLPTNQTPAALVAGIASDAIPVSGAGQSHLRARAKQLQAWIDEGLPGDLRVIEMAFDPSKAAAEPDPEKRHWLEEDLTELREAARGVAATMQQAHELDERKPAPTLASVVSVLRYRIATRAPLRPEADEPRVRIMTLHSAKGLEADNIVVMGAAQEIIPGDATPEDAAEQRRLLYVAVTRAKDRLIVSWSRAVAYADAQANGIHIGQVLTESGELVAKLSRTSLLPQALPGGVPGPAWLAADAE
jgi:DNA helicase-2/ATP-dependent DNA helicase PcrA